MSSYARTKVPGRSAVFRWLALTVPGMFLAACNFGGSDDVATGLPDLGDVEAQVTFSEFVFNERCVPYEIHPDFMRANGVDPDKIIDTFVDDGDFDGGTGNARNDFFRH